jgi:hypothetical protein
MMNNPLLASFFGLKLSVENSYIAAGIKDK